ISVGDGIELGFVGRYKHGLGAAPEVGAGHSDDVRPASRDELAQVQAELIVGIGRNVVELIDRYQSVVELLHAVGIDRKAERRVWPDQDLVVAFEKRAERLDLAAIVGAGRVAEVPLRLDMPVGPKAELGQRLVVEAGPDSLLRYDDDGLLQALILQ